MPKESFEQFIKRQKEKLDKVEKVVGEVKREWEGKIEEFEIVEKSVEELRKLLEENEGEAEKKSTYEKTFSFFLSLPLPEIPPFLLEKVSNKFLKEFDWKKFEGRKHLKEDLGLFLSAFLKKNIENYISSQKRKDIEEEKIKPIEIHLDVKELPVRVGGLGFQNPKKLHLIIEGNAADGTGWGMEGGEIIVKGDCIDDTGCSMKGGKIVVEGNCGGAVGATMEGGEIIVKGNCGDWTGSSMRGGKIVVEGNCGNQVGEKMRGGEIIVKGDCGVNAGYEMKNGVLILEGKVKSFDKSAFPPRNLGTIIWKGIKIWENGNWTKEGKEMKEKGKIPIE